MNELTPDLVTIADQLSEAIHRDERNATPPISFAKGVAIVVLAASLLGGTALAAGEITGAISLGDGGSAVQTQTSLGLGDPNLAYRYRLEGLPSNRDGASPIYIESTRALKTNPEGVVDLQALLRARHGCLSRITQVGTATVWIFDPSCDAAQP